MKADSRFAIVTNSYHVYRALVLAKRMGLDCIGYGAKNQMVFYSKCICAGVYCLFNDYLAFTVECGWLYWLSCFVRSFVEVRE